MLAYVVQSITVLSVWEHAVRTVHYCVECLGACCTHSPYVRCLGACCTYSPCVECLGACCKHSPLLCWVFGSMLYAQSICRCLGACCTHSPCVECLGACCTHSPCVQCLGEWCRDQCQSPHQSVCSVSGSMSIIIYNLHVKSTSSVYWSMPFRYISKAIRLLVKSICWESGTGPSIQINIKVHTFVWKSRGFTFRQHYLSTLHDINT